VSAGGLIVGCVALLVGVGLVAINKPYGRALERWNSKGPLPKINRVTGSDYLLRRTTTGRYPFIIAVGALFIVIGLLAVLVGPD